MVDNLILVALLLALAGMLVFSVIFTARANWRASALGRHMVYFGWSFSAAILSNLMRLIWQNGFVDFVRVTSLFVLAAVVWQRSFILLRTLKRDHAKR